MELRKLHSVQGSPEKELGGEETKIHVDGCVRIQKIIETGVGMPGIDISHTV